MRVALKLIITGILVFSLNPALADPPVDAPSTGVIANPQEKTNLGGDCRGFSDLPHISHHVPGTMNVQVRTICKGMTVSANGILTRISISNSPQIVTRSSSERNNVTINLSMPCVWKPGQPDILYLVSGVHTAGDRLPQFTRNFKRLKC